VLLVTRISPLASAVPAIKTSYSPILSPALVKATSILLEVQASSKSKGKTGISRNSALIRELCRVILSGWSNRPNSISWTVTVEMQVAAVPTSEYLSSTRA